MTKKQQYRLETGGANTTVEAAETDGCDDCGMNTSAVNFLSVT
jgi:hypothetical protein